MLSQRVDLTENNDFSSRNLSDFLINVDIVNDVANHHSPNMSTNMFDEIQKYGEVFGRKYHYNEVIDVFFNDDERFYRENRDICQRCGKYIRVPWKNFNNLCDVCDSIVDNEQYYMDLKIPWKTLPVTNIRDTARELFNMR